jgi:hypothetical protein
MGHRHQTGHPGHASAVEVDRDVVRGDHAPRVEAVRRVIRQQGIEGMTAFRSSPDPRTCSMPVMLFTSRRTASAFCHSS